jgi:hypothetical protein
MRYLSFQEICQSSYNYLFALLVTGLLCLMMPVLDFIAQIAGMLLSGDVKAVENLLDPTSV